MTKRAVNDDVWLVEQPDHAHAAGFLAAHWGNDEFTPLGSFEGGTDASYWRDEATFAVAQHDNGWQEWEAHPELDPADGLPLDFVQISQEQGLKNWRQGIQRFAETHPFAALLISWHARLLQEPILSRTREPQLWPPLFRQLDWTKLQSKAAAARTFVEEQQAVEQELLARAAATAADRIAQEQGVEGLALHFPTEGIPQDAPVGQDSFLMPHIRLLQVADALSLILCFGGGGIPTIEEVPRRSWDDRVTITVSSPRTGQIRLSPYPFDLDPLPVLLPARVLKRGEAPQDGYYAWRHRNQKELLRFEFTRG